jgi:hypothetical protein
MRPSLVLAAACSAVLVATPATANTQTARPSSNAAVQPDSPSTARLVARRDVDGDGDRDRIRFRALDANTVRVSVRLSQRRVVRKTLTTRSWPRGDFYGATRIDGRRGVELVIGTTWGAYTPWFTILTYRGGRLAIEKSPYYDTREWAVDAYANGYAGWYRRAHDGGVHIRIKYASRVGGSSRFAGRTIRYTWQHGAWDRSGTRRISFPNADRASRIKGWHVKGLPRWPR